MNIRRQGSLAQFYFLSGKSGKDEKKLTLDIIKEDKVVVKTCNCQANQNFFKDLLRKKAKNMNLQITSELGFRFNHAFLETTSIENDICALCHHFVLFTNSTYSKVTPLKQNLDPDYLKKMYNIKNDKVKKRSNDRKT